MGKTAQAFGGSGGGGTGTSVFFFGKKRLSGWFLFPPGNPAFILLMVQKSGVHQLRLVVYPIIYRVSYIPGG